MGCEAAAAPILLAEIANASGRGRVIGCHQVAITLGDATAATLGAALAQVPHGWRWLSAIVAVPAVLQVTTNTSLLYTLASAV
jgi:MFS transporter, SP family, solute carrier family 2 (myo-inositol transporter), member 13